MEGFIRDVKVAEYMYDTAKFYGLDSEEMYVLGMVRRIGKKNLKKVGIKFADIVDYYNQDPRVYIEDNNISYLSEIPRELWLLWDAEITVGASGTRISSEKRLEAIKTGHGENTNTYRNYSNIAEFINTYHIDQEGRFFKTISGRYCVISDEELKSKGYVKEDEVQTKRARKEKSDVDKLSKFDTKEDILNLKDKKIYVSEDGYDYFILDDEEHITVCFVKDRLVKTYRSKYYKVKHRNKKDNRTKKGVSGIVGLRYLSSDDKSIYEIKTRIEEDKGKDIEKSSFVIQFTNGVVKVVNYSDIVNNRVSPEVDLTKYNKNGMVGREFYNIDGIKYIVSEKNGKDLYKVWIKNKTKWLDFETIVLYGGVSRRNIIGKQYKNKKDIMGIVVEKTEDEQYIMKFYNGETGVYSELDIITGNFECDGLIDVKRAYMSKDEKSCSITKILDDTRTPVLDRRCEIKFGDGEVRELRYQVILNGDFTKGKTNSDIIGFICYNYGKPYQVVENVNKDIFMIRYVESQRTSTKTLKEILKDKEGEDSLLGGTYKDANGEELTLVKIDKSKKRDNFICKYTDGTTVSMSYKRLRSGKFTKESNLAYGMLNRTFISTDNVIFKVVKILDNLDMIRKDGVQLDKVRFVIKFSDDKTDVVTYNMLDKNTVNYELSINKKK